MSFGNVAVDSTSALQIVTLTNNQKVALAISPLTVTGSSFALDPWSSMTPFRTGAKCNLAFTLTPTSLGAQTGSLTITERWKRSADGDPDWNGDCTDHALSYLSVLWECSSELDSTLQIVTHQQSEGCFTMSPLTVTGSSFALDPSTTTCSTALAAGAKCNLAFTLTPTSLGAQTGSLTITTNAGNGPQMVTLTGTGIAQTTLYGSPRPWECRSQFDQRPPDRYSHQQRFFGHMSPLTVIWNSFALIPSTTCSTALAAGAKCNLAFTLTPTSLGAQTGSLTITTNAGNGPQMVTLTGTGIAQTTLSATSVSFGNVTINSTSALQIVTLTNNQKVALAISPLTVTGKPLCARSIDDLLDCVGRRPRHEPRVYSDSDVSQNATGSLTITTNAGNGPQMVTLSGDCQTTTLGYPNILLGNVAVNSTSALKIVTLTNNQTVALAISPLTVTGSSFALDPSTTCSTALAAGAKCNLAFTLTPTSLGAQTGSLTITTNAGNGPQMVTLTGTGIAQTTLSQLPQCPLGM